MKVSVYAREGGEMVVLVESTPGKGRSPILIYGVTGENVVDKVLPVVVELRKPRGEPITLPLM